MCCTSSPSHLPQAFWRRPSNSGRDPNDPGFPSSHTTLTAAVSLFWSTRRGRVAQAIAALVTTGMAVGRLTDSSHRHGDARAKHRKQYICQYIRLHPCANAYIPIHACISAHAYTHTSKTEIPITQSARSSLLRRVCHTTNMRMLLPGRYKRFRGYSLVLHSGPWPLLRLICSPLRVIEMNYGGRFACVVLV